MSNLALSGRDRQLYNKIISMPEFNGFTPNTSYLRQDVIFENNKGVIEFDFKQTRGAARHEQLLQDTDIFVANDMGLYIVAEEETTPGLGRLCTYPNKFQIDQAGDFVGGAAASAPVANHFNILYSGNTSVRVNQKEVYTAFPNRKFLQIPATQENGLNDYDSINYAESMVSLEPYLFLNAIWNNRIIVTFPTFNNNRLQANKAGWRLKLACVFSGMIIPGAAQKVNLKSALLQG